MSKLRKRQLSESRWFQGIFYSVCVIMFVFSIRGFWRSYNSPVYKFDIRTSPEWQKIFFYSWEHSKPEAAKELLGVWEVEEYWLEKLPNISRRVHVPWNMRRQFLIFEQKRFAVVDYNLRLKALTWSYLGTPVYGLDGEHGLRIFDNTLDELKKSPVTFQEGYGISSWKIQDDILYYYQQNGGKRQPPVDVPERPCPGIWRMARRVDGSNDDLGICRVDPAELPTSRRPLEESEIPPHILDVLEGRETKTPPPPIDPNGMEGQFGGMEELRVIPGFEEVVNEIDNAFPESSKETAVPADDQ